MTRCLDVSDERQLIPGSASPHVASGPIQQKESSMSTSRLVGFSMLFVGILALTPARAGAQVLDTIRFTAPFSFIAGKVELPAGTYTITPVGIDISAVFIRDFDHGVFVSVDPAGRPMSQAINAQSGEKLIF